MGISFQNRIQKYSNLNPNRSSFTSRKDFTVISFPKRGTFRDFYMIKIVINLRLMNKRMVSGLGTYFLEDKLKRFSIRQIFKNVFYFEI